MKGVPFVNGEYTKVVPFLSKLYTASSRKVVGKSARDHPERYCGWFSVPCFQNKFQRMAREATEVCLRGLKESKKVGSTGTVSGTSH